MAPASGKPGALVFFGHHMRTVPLSVYVIATLKKHFVVHYAPCSGGSIGRISGDRLVLPRRQICQRRRSARPFSHSFRSWISRFDVIVQGPDYGEAKYGLHADLLVGLMISIVIGVLALAVFLH